jgi:hypothetical protein
MVRDRKLRFARRRKKGFGRRGRDLPGPAEAGSINQAL